MRTAFYLMLAFGCFYGLGNYGLLDNNEGLYAAIARGMLHGESLIIPHLNSMPYIEKPPLLYWLTAASMWLLGENEWAARLPVALATCLLALGVRGFLARLNYQRAGLIAGLIVVSCPVILVIGRTVYFDMLLTASLAGALMAFYLWYREGKLGWLMACHGLIALAVLSKGFLAVLLAGGAALCFLITQRAWKRMWQAFDLRALAVFLLIAAPWHIAATLEKDDFAWFYFINEHVLRFFGKRVPIDYHRGPVWYYLPRILGYLFPWALLLPLLAKEKSGEDKTLRQFLWSWFLFTLVFFSMARAKSNYYLVAGMPPLIMLLALRIDLILREGRGQILWLFTAASLAATGIIIAAIPAACGSGIGDGAFLCSGFNPKTVTYALLATLAGIAMCLQYRRQPERLLWLMGVPAVLIMLIAINAAKLGEQSVSQKAPALYLVEHHMLESTALYHDFEEISALAFYTGHAFDIVETTSDDLIYGMKYCTFPDMFPSIAVWTERTKGTDAHILVRNHYLLELEARVAALPGSPKLCVEKAFDAVSILRHCE